MPRTNFFFKRQEFDSPEIFQPFYVYLGYYRKDSRESLHFSEDRYPLSIYFGKDEIAIYYTRGNGQVIKVYSLYVAEGYINQGMLSKKIEDYALMPLWPISEGVLEDELKNLRIDPGLLQTGFFAIYYGFELIGDRFYRVNLPGSRSEVVHVENEKKLHFRYWKHGNVQKKEKEEEWTIKEDGITPTKINFSKILLDFLFEMDFANTFEDENFYNLQPHLQNNLVLDALTKKCRYLYELYKARDFQQETRERSLPKTFCDAERHWLNVCRLESYKSVFTSSHSLFDDPEEEVENIFFRSKIGLGRKDRRYYLKNKSDSELKNNVCTFFMRKYDIWSAFRMLMPGWALVLLPLLLLFIPLGDYFLPKEDGWYKAGMSSVVLPIGMVGFMLFYNMYKGVNLFKLLLPRLFLGIMLGWIIFRSTEELWLMALRADAAMILIVDCLVLLIIFLYIHTDIGNQMYRKKDKKVLLKSVSLMSMALLISFVMGFYVILHTAKPLLENSGFLTKKICYTSNVPDQPLCLDQFFLHTGLKDQIKHFTSPDAPIPILNYKVHDLQLLGFHVGKIRYIWSILFSQFIMAILIGIILQMIWEDRPITEPL